MSFEFIELSGRNGSPVFLRLESILAITHEADTPVLSKAEMNGVQVVLQGSPAEVIQQIVLQVEGEYSNPSVKR